MKSPRSPGLLVVRGRHVTSCCSRESPRTFDHATGKEKLFFHRNYEADRRQEMTISIATWGKHPKNGAQNKKAEMSFFLSSDHLDPSRDWGQTPGAFPLHMPINSFLVCLFA